MDFYEKIAEYLLKQLDIDSASLNKQGEKEIIFRPLTNQEKGIAILDEPSETEIRFLDHSRYYNVNFQVSIKNSDQKKARQESYLIYQELDDFPRPDINGELLTVVSDSGSFILRSCEGVQLPQLLEITDNEEFIYILKIKANLLIQKN
ncbi:hypothetical protein IW492_11990 [Enterococcus sp. BWB1-3]|uniref:phage tail terminator protein n=1 Tax=unclassified Enterococcus TaxID=2608891 RepID=UPI0019223B3E|nr:MULTISPECIES: minor capsid protein [unclassified Enterococcus]MBL1229954.1 hypothetical protein [Enterococcus sp. BWB1-3]MCB5952952.1 minor capsid protein [Enterococcus sp. BWT-B8]MCB5953541.1 minor capsid protein [Enterococcus sp. CWB-B31]